MVISGISEAPKGAQRILILGSIRSPEVRNLSIGRPQDSAKAAQRSISPSLSVGRGQLQRPHPRLNFKANDLPHRRISARASTTCIKRSPGIFESVTSNSRPSDPSRDLEAPLPLFAPMRSGKDRRDQRGGFPAPYSSDTSSTSP